MFFQIRIAPKDQDMLRILWFDKPNMEGNVVAFRFQVAPYGLRCIPSIAGFSLLYTAEKNWPDVSRDAQERVVRDMFVDDFITGVDSIAEGKQVIVDVSKLLSSTGFTLTKWNASHEEILTDVANEDVAPARRDIVERGTDSCQPQAQTILGLVWDTVSENFLLKKPDVHIFDGRSFTRRQVASFNHRIFDPLA